MKNAKEVRRLYALCGVAATVLISVLLWLLAYGQNGGTCHTWPDGSRTCRYAA